MVRATWPFTLKVLNDGIDLALLKEWRQHRPDGLLVARRVFGTGPLTDMDHRLAETLAWANPLKQIGGPVYLEVPYNEEWQTGGGLDQLGQATVGAIDRIADAGFVPVVGIFSEGNPPWLDTDWPRFYPALRHARARGAVLGLHEYFTPGCFLDGWHSLRYRKVWALLPEDCRVPILITETGVDGGIDAPDGHQPQKGWRGYGDAQHYRDLLKRYRDAIAADGYVWGAHVFLCGTFEPGMWTSFDVKDEVELRPAFAEQVPSAPIWMPGPMVVPDPMARVDTSPPARVGPSAIRGLDVSNWQGLIDWDAVAAAGYGFAAIKASEDTTFLDRWFSRNWAETKRLGMVRIAYHFARPSLGSPADSVGLLQRALSDAGGLGPGDHVALDIEDTDVPASLSLHQWVAEWLDLAERVFGVRPLIYSGHWYTGPHDLEHPDLGTYMLWWAAYQDELPPPPNGWDRIAVWQFSAHAAVPGIGGDVDVDVFYGTADELRALGKPGVAVQPVLVVVPPTPVNPLGEREEKLWGPVYRVALALNDDRQLIGLDLLEWLTADKAAHGITA